MSKHPPPLPPGWGHPEPTGRAAPPPRRADDGRSPERVQFPANSRASGRRGAAERRRGSAPGEGGGRPCHAEAAHPHPRESWRPTAFSSQGKRGLPRLPHPPTVSPPPGDVQPAGLGPDLPSAGLRARGRAWRGGPRLPPAGRASNRGSRAPGHTGPALETPQPHPGLDRPRPVRPAPGHTPCAAGPNCRRPTPARPPAPTGLPAGLNKHPLLWERSPRASLQNLSSVNHGSSDFLIPGYFIEIEDM